MAAATPTGPGIGCDGHDHEHQERGQHELVDERAAGAHGGDRRAERGRLVGPDGQKEERARDGARQLGADVDQGVTGREVPAERERERDRRVDVRAGQMPGGVDHDHDDQPEHEADPHRTERPVVLRVGHDRAATGEHQGERGEALCGGAASERERPIHVSVHRIH